MDIELYLVYDVTSKHVSDYKFCRLNLSHFHFEITQIF